MNKLESLGIAFFGLMILGVITIFSSLFTVDPGERGFVVTFGQIGNEVYDGGIHFKPPFISTAIITNVQTNNIVDDVQAASKDLQQVSAKISVNCNINPGSVRDVYAQVGNNDAVWNNKLGPALQDTVKQETAKFTAEELITKRDEVSSLIAGELRDRMQKVGVNIQSINIVNFDFSDSFNKAIEDKVTAEQEALTAKNKLSTAEYQKEATITQAQGQAESIKIQSQSLQASGGPDYIELIKAQKWDGHLPTTVTSGVPLLNLK